MEQQNRAPITAESLAKKRRELRDAEASKTQVVTEKFVKQENPRVPVLGVELTPNTPDKSFGDKVFEDVAGLAYGIPVGITKVVEGFTKKPFETTLDLAKAPFQAIRDIGDKKMWDEHPVTNALNLLGTIQPVAGVVKASTIKSSINSVTSRFASNAAKLGIADDVAMSFVKNDGLKAAMAESYKAGSSAIATETARVLLTKYGVADDVARSAATSFGKSLGDDISRNASRLAVAESFVSPFESSLGGFKKKVDPLTKRILGEADKSAVGVLYGSDMVQKNPEGFLNIERWAEAQVLENGLKNTVENRVKFMQDWAEQNSKWGSLTPEGRVAHTLEYAKQELLTREVSRLTGTDLVSTKSLPQHYVDAMIQTVKESGDMDVNSVVKMLEDNYKNDFKLYSAEIADALTRNPTVEGLIGAISNLGKKRSLVSFVNPSPEVAALMAEIEGSGYRMGYAPKNKKVSYITDVMKDGSRSAVSLDDLASSRTKVGRFFEAIGLSPVGQLDSTAGYHFRQGFTQIMMNDPAIGGVVKAGKVSIPVEQLFQWLENRRGIFTEARKRKSFSAKTVFDITKEDLINANFAPEIAEKIFSATRQARREIPASVVGMADKVVNFLLSGNTKAGGLASRIYGNILKATVKTRYEWSPLYAFQAMVETKLNMSLLLKDSRVFYGGKTLSRLGTWTAEKFGVHLDSMKNYVKDVLDNPTFEELEFVRDDLIGELGRTTMDSSNPDVMQMQRFVEGDVRTLGEKASFETSIRSKNPYYAITGQSSVRMATVFNKGLANKFGMTLAEAGDYVLENGVKKYKNPEIVQMMKDATRDAFHYKTGFMTSPLMKTMNTIWFPLRFEVKTMQIAVKWMNSLTPMTRSVVMSNWIHFANWSQSEEGIRWRKTNKSIFYNILNYTTAYSQIGKTVEAVSKGRLFGGNAGLIGGIPFGFITSIARELALVSEDKDQFSLSGERFQKDIPRKLVSPEAFTVALETLLASMSPTMPFYSVTGGLIKGVSSRSFIEKFTRPVFKAATGEPLEDGMKTVPLDYRRKLNLNININPFSPIQASAASPDSFTATKIVTGRPVTEKVKLDMLPKEYNKSVSLQADKYKVDAYKKDSLHYKTILPLVENAEKVVKKEFGFSLPKGMLMAIAMKESSMGSNATSRRADLGQYAWLMGMTNEAYAEMKRRKVPVEDKNTPEGTILNAARFLASLRYLNDSKGKHVYDYLAEPGKWYVQKYYGKDKPEGMKAEAFHKITALMDYYQN